MKQKVLITGAGGGFGKLITHTLLQKGHEVVGTLRDVNGRNKLVAEGLKTAGAKVVEMDITSDQSVEKGVTDAIHALDGLDTVINNAGIGVLGIQEQFTSDDLKKVLDINVVGVHRVNRAALPYLRKQGQGTLLHISSLLGRIAVPFYGPYQAAKWGLEALVENYRVELSQFGIESAIVEPGGYPTSFFENLVRPGDTSRSAEFGEFINAPQGFFDGFEQALASNPAQNPQDVADAVLNVIESPFGKRPFRTVVDKMGMGEHIEKYNDTLDQITRGIYSNFQIDGMLEVKVPEQV